MVSVGLVDWDDELSGDAELDDETLLEDEAVGESRPPRRVAISLLLFGDEGFESFDAVR